MKRTKIEWCDHTWSPWTGCVRVSPGCDHCYAEALSHRFPATFGAWGPSAPRKRASDASWKAVRAWDRAAARAGERRRVFPSMCDPFDNQADPRDRADFFALIDATANLDWLLLTKRPQNVAKGVLLKHTLPPNVWLGVTAENQAEHDRRVPLLRSITSRVQFICAEPLLEPVRLDLTGNILGHRRRRERTACAPHAGRVGAKYARSVPCGRVPLFMKQMARREPIPDDLLIREFPSLQEFRTACRR